MLMIKTLHHLSFTKEIQLQKNKKKNLWKFLQPTEKMLDLGHVSQRVKIDLMTDFHGRIP